jgi:hypothetical protein
VFSAILVIILIANLWVLKRRPTNLVPYYSGLLITLSLNVIIPLDSFLRWTPVLQGIAAAVLVLSPVLFAGVVFAVLFSRSEYPEQALAYNTAGAILAGLAENASLLLGFRYLLFIAAAMYAAAWLVGRNNARGLRPAAVEMVAEGH